MANQLLTNSFEEGTNGVAVSASNSGAPGTLFDAVTIGTGATLAYDNTHAAHGSLAAKITTGGTGVNDYMTWNTTMLSWQSQMYFRAYLYFAVNPTNGNDFCGFFNVNTVVGRFRLGTSGKVLFLDSAGVTQLTSTNSVPTAAWFRVEGWVIGSATVGQAQFAIYTGSGGDSTSALETQTSGATLNTNSVPNTCRFGLGQTAASASYWIDDVALANYGPLIGAVAAKTDTDTGSGLDGGKGPSGGTHETVGVDDAVGFP